MESLKTLSYHCLGTAELEKSFLNEAYVNDGKTEEIIQKSLNSPVLLVGKKGSGKSAIFLRIQAMADEAGLDSLFIKPDDIILHGMKGDSLSIGEVKRESYFALLRAIAAQIGSKFDGLLNLDQKLLREQAVKSGIKDNDAVEKLSKVLSVLGKPLTEVNLEVLLHNESHGDKKIERTVSGELSSKNKVFLLLIDDTDQIVPSYRENDITKIWGFLLAVKKLTEEISNIKCVVSLRTEVWRTLSQNQGQRDQVDHFRPLKYDLDVSDEEIAKILRKRFEFVSSKLGLTTSFAHRNFFVGEDTKLPTSSSERRHWSDFIVKNSRSRPRDAIQLCKLFCDSAISHGKSKIEESLTESVIKQYSDEKVEDLEAEFQSECPNIKSIIRCFSDQKFEVDTETLRKHLEKIPSHCSVVIRGISVANGNPDSIFVLWRFLHEVGFLNARVEDSRGHKSFRHITFDDDQNYVSKGNWTEMQKCHWEIHPAYRLHLLQLRSNELHRIAVKKSNKQK